MHPLLADPWVAAQIEAAIAPYRKLWPDAAIEAFREQMAATLATHPAAIRLLREARPIPVEPSGEVYLTGAGPVFDTAAPTAGSADPTAPRKTAAK
jgi:hypothetical protein